MGSSIEERVAFGVRTSESIIREDLRIDAETCSERAFAVNIEDVFKNVRELVNNNLCGGQHVVYQRQSRSWDGDVMCEVSSDAHQTIEGSARLQSSGDGRGKKGGKDNAARERFIDYECEGKVREAAKKVARVK